MRKLFSLFLALVATTSLWAENFSVDGIYYYYLDGNNVEVTYRGNYSSSYDEYSGEVIIPSTVTYNGITYSVTSIGDWAFSWCSSLTSITIPNSVTNIGDEAFYECSSLTSITIPNSVTSIGKEAFYECSSLTSITIPNSVTSIGFWAFAHCSSSLTSMVVEEGNTIYDSRDNCNAIIETATNTLVAGCQNTIIPNSVTSIGNRAFAYCSSLPSVTIPNSVTSIGNDAFYGCSYLFDITIPNSVTSIGRDAFRGTGIYNDNSNWENDVLYIDNCLIDAKESISGTYTIKENTRLIADYAFEGCSKLTAITIPNSVTSIGNSPFGYRSSLTSVVVESGNATYDSRENCNAIIETATNTLIAGCQNTVIPNSVTSIGVGAFYGCSKLTAITIPNSVMSIGNSAFSSCTSLTSITIPNSVTSIGNGAFNNCYSLTSVTIPNNVTSIGVGAFYNCSSLTSITIPNSVTSIGDGAFGLCESLTSIVVESGNATYDSRENCNAIIETATNTLIAGCQNTVIPNSVTSIGVNAFEFCHSLTSVIIPNSVTSIGDGAFYECTSLTSITIPNSMTSIGNSAFAYCSRLTAITIPESVTSIGNNAFYYCSKLTSITCEAETPPTLGSDAFYAVSKSIPVYVPCGCVKAYKTKSGWKDFTNIQVPLAEYSIEVDVNGSIMGTAKVNYNTFCEGNQISATPNFGYHFVRWSDGNTDNPRTFTLTQDTVLTAEFAPNTYTITTVSSDTQRGTTQGDTIANYLDIITICANANYGYHFTQWNDANVENPRQVQVTGDATYTATFDKNTYAISLSCNEEQGSVEGVTSAEYLDTVTISATPNFGYHFVKWSDGSTDTIRTLVLTQDTILTAEFALTIAGQCGDNLYWSYDETAKTVSITGSGKMYDYTADTQPWLLFKEEIKEVIITNTATSIGTSAFEGCIRLGKVSIGTAMVKIGANAFAGCTRLYDIYVYATYPPFADESSFANYNVYLYVPCENQREYILDIVWGKFKFIECFSADEVEDTEDVEIDAGSTDVTITWPTEEGADTYTIVIRKDGQVVCTLTFNAEGQLLNIAFAPGRNGNHSAQYAEAVANGKGFRFTVTGLEEGTDYTYDITATDESDNTLATHSGEFTTQSNVPTDLENIDSQSPEAKVQKFLRDGQLIILRDGVEYNAIGQEL